MTMLIVVIVAAVLLSIGITAAITAVLTRFFGSTFAAALVGGLTLPVLLICEGVYDLSNLEVDSPPPGMLLLGGLTILFAATPFTLLTSFRVVRWQRRRKGS